MLPELYFPRSEGNMVRSGKHHFSVTTFPTGAKHYVNQPRRYSCYFIHDDNRADTCYIQFLKRASFGKRKRYLFIYLDFFFFLNNAVGCCFQRPLCLLWWRHLSCNYGSCSCFHWQALKVLGSLTCDSRNIQLQVTEYSSSAHFLWGPEKLMTTGVPWKDP